MKISRHQYYQGRDQSFDGSSGLFSFGLTVERTTMNLFSMSNQNGAPSESARAVTSQPTILKSQRGLFIYTDRGSFSLSGDLVQPIGNPSFWLCARFWWIRH